MKEKISEKDIHRLVSEKMKMKPKNLGSAAMSE